MKALVRLVALIVLAGCALEVFFIARIALAATVAPQSTAFQRSEAYRIATQKVAKAVKKAVGCQGIMLMQLNGSGAGQSVPHLHFHILPRAGGLDMQMHGRTTVDPKDLIPVAEKIRAAL